MGHDPTRRSSFQKSRTRHATIHKSPRCRSGSTAVSASGVTVAPGLSQGSAPTPVYCSHLRVFACVQISWVATLIVGSAPRSACSTPAAATLAIVRRVHPEGLSEHVSWALDVLRLDASPEHGRTAAWDVRPGPLCEYHLRTSGDRAAGAVCRLQTIIQHHCQHHLIHRAEHPRDGEVWLALNASHNISKDQDGYRSSA
ncbi:hypothetical protein Mesau_02749 [Mesorhizobium australicum WSM2073]|uniref:Uncharacterized protein n=1 Tax=Mesorhizobium australicum (strain HAMBI 3006 / LMG 24608 / WSM2073) TaxID=754035 RepID=L0KM33_MESAW|nr:hypothetical protein Mesau_02749 [Mesorhizobium australicum WSM2073]